MSDSLRLRTDFHRNRMKLNGKSKADLRFRGKQAFTADARNSEAVTQVTIISFSISPSTTQRLLT